MRVSADCELFERKSPKRMSTPLILTLIFSLLVAGAGLYIVVDATRPERLIEEPSPQTADFQETSRIFRLNDDGEEVPIKFASGTEKVSGKIFIASIFIKIPLDLIDNGTFVGRIIELVETEIEDAIDEYTNGSTVALAEFTQPARKAYEDIIEAVFLVKYKKGRASFFQFVYPIVKQFDKSVKYYNELLNEFYSYGMFYEDEEVALSEEQENSEDYSQRIVGLIERLQRK